MEGSKKYYKYIDIIRLLACISVLLYHLNILKGGFLAVCTFFVLSGYLSCVSAFKEENFSFVKYYINRILKLYFPLALVTFISLTIISLFPNVFWLNLKPETTSVLLGYNNFWQLNANMDYFACQASSPFIHFWYLAILLQFDLIFPFIFVILRKLGDKFHKVIPCIITFILVLISTFYFYKTSLDSNIMFTYYNTFSRLFSLFFGLMLGFIHNYYGSIVPKILKNSIINKIIFYLYLLVLIVLFVYTDFNSKYFALNMILSTLITCRLLDYSSLNIGEFKTIIGRFIKSLSDCSYEIYLLQYPIIFILQSLNVEGYLYLIMVIAITLLLSFILHYFLNMKENRGIVFKYVIFMILLCLTLYGVYQYYLAVDHTSEMKELEKQLAQNAEWIKQSQENYQLQEKQDNEDWLNTLKELENAESAIAGIVSDLQVAGIGDSVMLGAVPDLYNKFPNGYFDAKVSRFTWNGSKVVNELKEQNLLGNPVIVHLGTNGDCSTSCKAAVMDSIGDKEVYWINTTNSNKTNDNLVEFASIYNNLHIIDWKTISTDHDEYFYADKIHLTPSGRIAYTNAIYDAIYENYLKKYMEQKQEIINKHEQELKNKISFYGNELLLNSFEYLNSDFKKAQFNIDKDFSYDSLVQSINNSIQENTLEYNVVFIFDSNFNLTEEEYNNLIKLCKGHKLYFISTNEDIAKMFVKDIDNLVTVDFYTFIQNNPEYLMPDKIHLTKSGNEQLSSLLENIIILRK